MDLVAWLEQHQRKSLTEIKGIMSHRNCPDPSAFERAQYVRGLSGYTSLFTIGVDAFCAVATHVVEGRVGEILTCAGSTLLVGLRRSAIAANG